MTNVVRVQEQRISAHRKEQENRDLTAEAILATIAYHDLLDMPLTAMEAWRFLIRPHDRDEIATAAAGPHRSERDPARGGGRQEAVAPSLQHTDDALRALVAGGRLETIMGYFTLPGRIPLVRDRLDRHARAQEKWKRLRRIVWWLQAVPFLRMVAGSGSLAREHVREGSDLDVLIVAAPGHIWTVRFLVTVLLDVLGLRRRPTGPTNDLVCLNHYLTLDQLELPYRSLYTAYEYARLVPLIGDDILRQFRAQNRVWMEEYLVRVLPDDALNQKRIRPSRILRVFQWTGEHLLFGPVGRMVERSLGGVQRRRIAAAGAAEEPGRIVATASHLEFHPRSHEAPLLAAFNERMAVLGLPSFGGQHDSGLTLRLGPDMDLLGPRSG